MNHIILTLFIIVVIGFVVSVVFGIIETVLLLSFSSWYFNIGPVIFTSSISNLVFKGSRIKYLEKNILPSGWIIEKANQDNLYFARSSAFNLFNPLQRIVLKFNYDEARLEVTIRICISYVITSITLVLFMCLFSLAAVVQTKSIVGLIIGAVSSIVILLALLPKYFFNKQTIKKIAENLERENHL